LPAKRGSGNSRFAKRAFVSGKPTFPASTSGFARTNGPGELDTAADRMLDDRHPLRAVKRQNLIESTT
jgi:hypothetical protein